MVVGKGGSAPNLGAVEKQCMEHCIKHLPVSPHAMSPAFNRERSVSSGSQCWHPTNTIIITHPLRLPLSV